MKKLIFFSVSLLLFLFQVSVLPGQEGKIEKGVRVIANPDRPVLVAGKPVAVTLEENLRIGDKPEEKNDLFFDIRGACVDSDGRIIVLDWKDFKIKIFDGQGKRLNSFGKKGQGPEEWGQPQSLSLTPENHILVFDPGNKRLGVYTRDGRCLKEIPLGKLFPDPTRMDAEGNILACTVTWDGKVKINRLDKYDPSLAPLSSLVSIRADVGPSHNNVYPEWILFDSYGPGDWILAFTEKYELSIIDGHGTLKKKIIKDDRRVNVTEARKKAYIEKLKKSLGDEAGDILPLLIFPSAFPPIASFKTDEQCRVYVKTYEMDDRGNALYDVFDAEGRYICRFSHPDAEHLFAVRKDEAYFFMKEDDDGLPLIKRYRLVWK